MESFGPKTDIQAVNLHSIDNPMLSVKSSRVIYCFIPNYQLISSPIKNFTKLKSNRQIRKQSKLTQSKASNQNKKKLEENRNPKKNVFDFPIKTKFNEFGNKIKNLRSKDN